MRRKKKETVYEYKPRTYICRFCGSVLAEKDLKMKDPFDPMSDAICRFCGSIVG